MLQIGYVVFGCNPREMVFCAFKYFGNAMKFSFKESFRTVNIFHFQLKIFTTCFGKRDGILKEPNFNVEVWNSLNVFDTEFTGNLAKITKNLMEFSKFVMSINDNLDKVSAEVQKNLSSVTLELMSHQLPLNFSTMIFTKSLDQQTNRSTQNAFRTMKKYQRIIFGLQTHIMDVHEIVFEKVITGAGDLRKELQNFIIDSNISNEELDTSQEKAYVEIFKSFGGMTDQHYEKIAKIIKGVATDLNRLLMRHPEIFQYSNAALKMMDDVDKCLMGFSQNNLNIYKVMDSFCTVNVKICLKIEILHLI